MRRGLVLSSGLFGLAHSPIIGANAALEAVLGGYFGFVYGDHIVLACVPCTNSMCLAAYFGHNIWVPITVHVLYDFFTLLSSHNSLVLKLNIGEQLQQQVRPA
jgi:membrane protease YdiL (CAAX protease family)